MRMLSASVISMNACALGLDSITANAACAASA